MLLPGALLLAVVSCGRLLPPALVELPTREGPDALDSSQARVVFEHMRDFPNGSQLSLCLLSGDFEKYVGVLRRNDSLVYVANRDSAFEIGSITKTFTAALLAKLVLDGRVRLDDPIQSILPIRLHQGGLRGKEVTLLHLANHTSGFPKEPDNISDEWSLPGSPYRTYDEGKLYDYLSHRLTLRSAPGERREYSNLGGGLLGHLLCLTTGKRYEDLLQECICRPLGLRQTFVVIDSERSRCLVRGRNPAGNIVPNWELNVLAGGGGIKSTAADMAKYLRTQMTDTTFFFLTQQPTFEYTEHNVAGLGWAWYRDGERNYLSATGGTGGYSCCVIFERSTRTGIVLLTNVSAFLAAKGEHITNMSRELGDPLVREARRTAPEPGL
jgi:CubicO group peptidase (beta-lactamase class C family)